MPQFSKEIEDCHIVATSVWVARWHRNTIHEQRLDLAPTWEIVDAIKNNKITWEEYDKAYLALLKERKINAKQLINELPNNTFLLCFESPTDRCHRHLLSNWIHEQTGFKITEWKTPKERHVAAKQDNLESLLDL